MNETEKMYRNAGIDKKTMCEWICKNSPGCNVNCKYYRNIKEYYPPFTAEKQLELIKWLSDTDYYIHNIYKTIDTKEYCIENDFYDIQMNEFEEALAGLINKLWIDMSKEEKQQIKEILE